MSGCKNPFAPRLDFSSEDNSKGLTDLTTIDGIFQSFQFAYSFRDTSIYGKIVGEDFIFTYRDYEKGFDVSWGRDDEMKTTNGLFTNSQRLDLIWNNIVLSNVDSVKATIVRGFNLTVTFNPTDVVRIDGRVNLSLKRDDATQNWKMVKWLDESSL
ncbi:MAG: hypothetical protein COW08_05015 [Ignavibacteriales bacterium CG12_big_fil_rev_8_21_14_0_65_30_8]|nr:MAG: hypothetical protein COW08_05015 [Ignavibacteriales bacterium CG12_big_fil_rev_8_21_14_0_65_30_8]